MIEVFNYIDGERVASQTIFEKRSPVTGVPIAEVYEADASIVDQAVTVAREAWPAWEAMDVETRARVLYNTANEIEKRADAFVEAECADIGRPSSQVRAGHVMRTADIFRMYADELRHWDQASFQGRASSPNIAPEDAPFVNSYTVRHAKGVVGIIAPWNVPLLLLALHVAPALAAGNTVVAKPSEESPQSAVLLAEAFATAAAAAGAPRGVFNVIHGFGANSAGEFLVNNDTINAYGFTGDSSTGKIIMRGAASGLRDVLLELGGKNVGIIFPDADLEEAAKTCAMASFTNTGQVCLSIEKLYVAREIFEPFMTLFVNHARKITLGGPSDDRADIGPLISKKHRERVQSFVDNACEEGAEIICGGKAPSFGDERDNGYFFEPTILTGLSEDAHVMTNEIFGPVCHVGPFDSEAEVLGYANQPPYGLISMIWTKDVSRAHRFGRSIRAGINWVNCWQVRYLRTPLQGFDQSGVGTQGGRQSLEFYTNVSTVTMML